MTKVALLLLGLAGLIIASAIAFYVYGSVNLQQAIRRDTSIQECLKISSYTVTSTDSGITTVEPIESVYRKCLELKGI